MMGNSRRHRGIMMMRPPWLSLFCCCLLLMIRFQSDAQRVQVGCYDASPVVCDANPTPESELEFSVEETCRKLALEYFPNDDDSVLWDVSSHYEYIDTIDSTSTFCSQLRQAYSHCLWCQKEEWEAACFDGSWQFTCGGKPTRDEVLADSNEYGYFETEADIDRTCEELEQVRENQYQLEPNLPMPASVGLCERQLQVRHLCPGECEGGCFVEPPTCSDIIVVDTNTKSSKMNETTAFDYCNTILWDAFHNVPTSVILDPTQHFDYLKRFNATYEDCDNLQQAYHQCVWCADELCFNDDYPATCDNDDPPTIAKDADATSDNKYNYNYTHAEINNICKDVYFRIYDVNFWTDDLFNLTLHTNNVLVKADSTLCIDIRNVLHECFWCAPDGDADFCLPQTVCNASHGIPQDHVSDTLQALNLTQAENPSDYCTEIQQFKPSSWSDLYTSRGCYEDVFMARLCPEVYCPEAESADNTLNEEYLGADTTRQKRALIWLSRTAAFLSFFGAMYILYDILSTPKNRSSVYHQLLVGMASFDSITAVAWCFATAPIDTQEGGHVEGSMGNEATCTTQAFFIQLGLTSVFYNVSLAIYYVLVVAHGWRDFQLQTVKLPMHAVPLVCGLALAFAGLPFYGWFEYGCHLTPYPDGPLWTILVFFAIPLGLSIAAITVSMLMVYCKVRKQAAASRQWSFGVGQANRMEQRVFWQCLSYAGAFYLTWPILFSVYLAAVDVGGPLGLTMTVAFVAPLQGFNNFLVYIRPKFRKQRTNDMRGSTRTTMLTRLKSGISSRWHSSAPPSSAHLTTQSSQQQHRDDSSSRNDDGSRPFYHPQKTTTSVMEPILEVSVRREEAQSALVEAEADSSSSSSSEESSRRMDIPNAASNDIEVLPATNNVDDNPTAAVENGEVLHELSEKEQRKRVRVDAAANFRERAREHKQRLQQKRKAAKERKAAEKERKRQQKLQQQQQHQQDR